MVLAVIVGCGSADELNPTGNSAQPTGGSSNTTGGSGSQSSDFLFLEDEDPALADQPFVEDELITMTYPGSDSECVADAILSSGATALRTSAALNTTIVRVDPARFVETAEALAATTLVESVHKNYLFRAERASDDPDFAQQTYLNSIRATEAWDVTTGSANSIIAVLDTGVAVNHADLSARLMTGWNTFDNNADTDDVAGHGTSVAGVLGAVTGNNVGIAGVTWVGDILPIRVTNEEGLASAQSIADGIVWAADHGATIANVSFAPLHADETIRRAAEYMRAAGGLVFISAGNDSLHHDSEAYDAAVFVGAVDASNQLASFSSTGPFVDITAPGVGIYTTSADGAYRNVSGTSFASPIAAGVASLVWSVRPQWSPGAVAQLLFDSAVDLGPAGRDESFGTGLIDAAAAVAMAQAADDTTDTQAPEVTIIAPSAGAAIEDYATVEVEANDDSGIVANVVLYIDGKLFAADAFAPYSFVIDIESLDEGEHTLSCVATDDAGNASAPAAVSVSARSTDVGDRCIAPAASVTPPVATIEFPVDGATVEGSIGIRVTVTDDDGLAGVALLIDGSLIEGKAVSGLSATVDFVWDATDATPGPHRLTVRTTDEQGSQTRTTITVHKL